MRTGKTMLASAAALGLIAAPISAQAAQARTATPVDRTEKLGGETLLYIAVAAAAIALVVIFSSDDEDELPTSP